MLLNFLELCYIFIPHKSQKFIKSLSPDNKICDRYLISEHTLTSTTLDIEHFCLYQNSQVFLKQGSNITFCQIFVFILYIENIAWKPLLFFFNFNKERFLWLYIIANNCDSEIRIYSATFWIHEAE